MPKPHPYPLNFGTASQVLIPSSAMIEAPATRWQDDPKFSYVSAQAYPGWFQSAPGIIANFDGFTFGGEDPVQKIIWSLTPADYPVLVPNGLYRVQGLLDWYRYVYAVSPIHSVLVKCNGQESYNPPEGWLGWGTGDPGRFNMIVQADGSGNLNFEAGVYVTAAGISGSVSIGWSLTELEVATVDDQWDIIPDSAIVYIGTKALSTTREGARFDPRIVFENYDYPGKAAPTHGLDEIVSMAPAILVKVMEIAEWQLLTYLPGSTFGSSSFDRTLTHHVMRQALSTGFSLSDVRTIWKRWSGGYLQARFPKAFCQAWALGAADQNEGEMPIEISARQDLTGVGATPKSTAVFYIDRLPSTWTI